MTTMKLRIRCTLVSRIIIGVFIFGCLQFLAVQQYLYCFADRGQIASRNDGVVLVNRDYRLDSPTPQPVRIFPDGREVRHIAFIKTHKAASGTATSIFFRFGVTRGLTFIVPKILNIISKFVSITDSAIYPRLNKTFDIMTSHVIYNKTVFEKYLPADTVYIGILREPFQQFKSTMNYMAPQYVYDLSKTSPIQEYLKTPMKHENPNPAESWINNRQSVEFGFPREVIMKKNNTTVYDYINQLDKEIHLVIITEYFDESVVLMRRMLNWTTRDILYRVLHTRGWDRKLTIPRPNDRRMYRRWASVDYALYEFFYARLWRQMKTAGSDIFDEVLHFKQVRAEVDDFCRAEPNNTSYIVPRSKWSAEFTVAPDYCKLIFSEEEEFVAGLAETQYNVTRKQK